MSEILKNMPNGAECSKRLSIAKLCTSASKDARKVIRARVQALKLVYAVEPVQKGDERLAVVEAFVDRIEIDRAAFASVARFVGCRVLIIARHGDEYALYMSYKDKGRGVYLLRADRAAATWEDAETTSDSVRRLCVQLFELFREATDTDERLGAICAYRVNDNMRKRLEEKARKEVQCSRALEYHTQARAFKKICDDWLAANG